MSILLATAGLFAQRNGKLQLHFMDVGQGDGALLISPNGETVLFDNGDWRGCEKPVDYLRSLGISRIDYMIVSHYHSDHIGCTKKVLDEFPLQKFSYDRPGEYDSDSYRSYVAAVGSKRKHVWPNMSLILDEGSANPVRINIAAYNGAGLRTKNENDRTVVAVVHFGNFNAMMAGDLSGANTSRYRDIETRVSRRVGQVEVYKINHHGSEHSSNATWLRKLKPKIAIVSAGVDSEHGHPTTGALRRLRDAGTEKIYWTTRGGGATPFSGVDVVANGSILVEVTPGANAFDVRFGSQTTTHAMWMTPYNGRR